MCFLALLAFFSAGFSKNVPELKPNVLLITSEDNGPELGCYGDPYVRTPHLDGLAAQGVRFKRAFVPTASCSESRSALLTGLYPHQNGQIGLATHHYRQFDNVPNLVGSLKAHGYRTGIIGKLHINPESAFPFDYRPDVTQSNTFSHRDVQEVARLARRFFGPADGPFFLMVNYADAHLRFLRQQHGLPLSPLSGNQVSPLPWIGIDNPRLRESQANYYNCIMRLDEGIGALLKALRESGRSQNTLVVYLGDHGAQFPRGKLASYESSLHVPLILRLPGRIPAGVVRDQLVTSLDLLPTIMESVGVQSPIDLPGRSLLPLLQKQRPNRETRTMVPAWREYLFSEYHGHYPPLYFPQRAVRGDRYKLILNLLRDRPNPVAAVCSQSPQPSFDSYVSKSDVESAGRQLREAYDTWAQAPPVELYDLVKDPYEWQNRADDPSLSEVKVRLLDELRTWQKETADPLADPDKLAKLTEEHDTLEKPYQRPRNSHWKYSEYLAPRTGESSP